MFETILPFHDRSSAGGLTLFFFYLTNTHIDRHSELDLVVLPTLGSTEFNVFVLIACSNRIHMPFAERKKKHIEISGKNVLSPTASGVKK